MKYGHGSRDADGWLNGRRPHAGLPPRFIGGGRRLSIFDDDPGIVPAELVGSLAQGLDEVAREGLRTGPISGEEELAYAQRVSPVAHLTAERAVTSAQDGFRSHRQFDQHRYFLAPDGHLYERSGTTPENEGWTIRRRLLGLAGHSDDPTLEDLTRRYFRFASDYGATPPIENGGASAGSGSQAITIPQILIESERRKSVLDDTPAIFPIAPNPDADGSAPWYADDHAGAAAVRAYHDLAVEEAGKAGVDPQLLLAILYIENAQGHYAGAADVAEDLGLASSLFPMNIKPRLWERLSPYAGSLADPRNNFAAAASLLRRIGDRVPGADIAKLAALYHGLGLETVDDYGARVAEVYRTSPWHMETPTIGDWIAP